MKSIGKNRTKVAVIAAALFLALFLGAGQLMADPVHVTCMDRNPTTWYSSSTTSGATNDASRDPQRPFDYQRADRLDIPRGLTNTALGQLGHPVLRSPRCLMSWRLHSARTDYATFLVYDACACVTTTTVSYFLIEGTYTASVGTRITVRHDDGVSILRWTHLIQRRTPVVGIRAEADETTAEWTFPGGDPYLSSLRTLKATGHHRCLMCPSPRRSR